ncbi:MAG TPA: TrbI/VirB10 family protein [Caulobacteraceae bacterium]|jgi:type IV secretion system protein VirB10
MIDSTFSVDRDPRLDAGADELSRASVRSAPEVARTASAAEGLGLAVGLIGAAALGGLTIVSLAHHRASAPAAPPLQAAKATVASSPPRPASVTVSAPALAPPATLSASPSPSPVLVVDSSTTPSSPATSSAIRSPPASATPSKSGVFFSPDEQFTARAGDEAVPTSHVQRLDHPDKIIAQGAVIPAVLETALNSDLPGYARALVSRDVRSFDGSQVLIPRGSRLVGQYKSALETGQSRMLIVWTRVLRSDGVSIQLGSPTTDDQGEAGLSGKVDRHFMQRFGSAILLSVVGGLASAAGSGNTVVVGTATQGSTAAGVALQNDVKISPTVRVMQGAAIQVFVARDLDFSENAP